MTTFQIGWRIYKFKRS